VLDWVCSRGGNGNGLSRLDRERWSNRLRPPRRGRGRGRRANGRGDGEVGDVGEGDAGEGDRATQGEGEVGRSGDTRGSRVEGREEVKHPGCQRRRISENCYKSQC